MGEKEHNFGFCFKKAKGLKLVSLNDNLVEVYKRKSRSALNMLTSAIEKDEIEWILDTSYYAKYFMAYALFMKTGIKSEIHDCTIFALKSIFNFLGIISFELCKDLEDSRDIRVASLYYDKDFGKKEILIKAGTTSSFCLKIESILDTISKKEIFEVRTRFEELAGGCNLEGK
jgi:uncharacterized protein (UPF0332 family)